MPKEAQVLSDPLIAEALAIVQANRAGSIPLLQRRLAVDPLTAEALLQAIANETGVIQRLPGGVYTYTPPAIARNSTHCAPSPDKHCPRLTNGFWTTQH
ncbi:hypothetical protein [Cupriavidus sp. D39]|uniref:hypothetical protein n=1 Tax=Cupriavidus sp. D39 TaxID=2997877 RepID=UPI002271770E|nr:hypothetical protein [Cupriavidus sp. D39]MCY0852430.1 hypothetical protein [Cupriavidus sp. D39]